LDHCPRSSHYAVTAGDALVSYMPCNQLGVDGLFPRGVIGTYYRPFLSVMKNSLRGKSATPNPVEGSGVGWLRSWARRLSLGELTVGPLSTKSRL